MKIRAIETAEQWQKAWQDTCVAPQPQKHRPFVLTTTEDEARALLHDLSGTIRTFRYIVASYGDGLSADDPLKAAKLAQLEERLNGLEQLRHQLSPLIAHPLDRAAKARCSDGGDASDV